jgi:hypothetical protein
MSGSSFEQFLRSKLAKLGLAVTCLYIIGLIAIYVKGPSWGLLNRGPMELNELGDFLAGVFGPLSLFWLILGFFQQSSELRLQVAELQNSVAQQRELVAVTRETLDHDKARTSAETEKRLKQIAPLFELQWEEENTSPPTLSMYDTNVVFATCVSGPGLNVSVQSSPPLNDETGLVRYWQVGEKRMIGKTQNLRHARSPNPKIKITSQDVERRHHTQVF